MHVKKPLIRTMVIHMCYMPCVDMVSRLIILGISLKPEKKGLLHLKCSRYVGGIIWIMIVDGVYMRTEPVVGCHHQVRYDDIYKHLVDIC